MATRREQVWLVGGILLGAGLMLLLAVAVFGLNLFGHTRTTITLRPEGPNAACLITGKETEITVGKNKKIIWTVINHCPQVQTLSVGNFRSPSDSAEARDCAAPVAGSAPYPFTRDALADRQVVIPARRENRPSPRSEKLELKVRPRDADGGLPAEELRYAFDICLEGRIADPRLIIER